MPKLKIILPLLASLSALSACSDDSPIASDNSVVADLPTKSEPGVNTTSSPLRRLQHGQKCLFWRFARTHHVLIRRLHVRHHLLA